MQLVATVYRYPHNRNRIPVSLRSDENIKILKYHVNSDIDILKGIELDRVVLLDLTTDDLSNELKTTLLRGLNMKNGTIESLASYVMNEKPEIPSIATVYKQDDGSLWITVRKYIDMRSFECDIKLIRGNSFSKIYLLNMELSEIPKNLQLALQNTLIMSKGLIESVYYDKNN